MSRATLPALLAGLALIGTAAGCGSDDSGSTAPTTAPAATATTPPTTTTTSPEDQPAGAGDEQAAVVPATFTFAEAGVTPPKVEVPAFFKIRVTAISRDGQAHTIVFQGTTLDVPAGSRASATVEGLKAGSYPVGIDGSSAAAQIVTGVDPGP